MKITDEMVEAGATAISEAFKSRIEQLSGEGFAETGVSAPSIETFTRYARAALEAALTGAGPQQAVEPVAWRYRQNERAVWQYSEGSTHISGWILEPLYAHPTDKDAVIAYLRAALQPFADVADFMDSETSGFSQTDTLSLICRDENGAESALFSDFEVKDFYSARAALAEHKEPR